MVRECAIAFGVLLIFMFFGRHFLNALHLSEVSLRIGGAVILLLIAIRMIFPHPDGVLGKTDGGEPFIVPLAIPALAGPSALATVLLFSANTMTEIAVNVAALAAVGVVWLAVFLSAEKLQESARPASHDGVRTPDGPDPDGDVGRDAVGRHPRIRQNALTRTVTQDDYD